VLLAGLVPATRELCSAHTDSPDKGRLDLAARKVHRSLRVVWLLLMDKGPGWFGDFSVNGQIVNAPFTATYGVSPDRTIAEKIARISTPSEVVSMLGSRPRVRARSVFSLIRRGAATGLGFSRA
jgi:hypothetical protein